MYTFPCFPTYETLAVEHLYEHDEEYYFEGEGYGDYYG